MNSPASPSAPTSSLDGQLLPGAIGGNLARVHPRVAFSIPTRVDLHRASRGVRLSRDAQSGALVGMLLMTCKLREPLVSFPEQPQQFGAQYANAGWVYLLSPASAGAVSRGFPSSHPPRPFPSVLPKVDHITHRGGAPIFVDETKFTRSAFA